jgi:glycosyltransferase involved in cell wall biosynthesis
MSQAPRHVLLTTDAVGGIWTYTVDLAQALVSRNVKATIAVIGPGPGAGQRREASRLGLRLVETGFPLDWWGVGPDEIAASGQAIADFADEHGVDLVHLHAPSLAANAAFSMAVVGSCHSCLATWWEAVKQGEMPPEFRWRTALLAEGYAACDRLVAPSRSFGEATAKKYGVSPAVVRNGRRIVLPPEGSGRTGEALTSGRLWDAGKNMATLDRAAARMKGRIAAAGALRGPHGEAIAPAHVETLGQLDADALAERLSKARVFVSLALYEPFGLGVLEAAQAGCALVLSDIPTFRELWDDAAIFVPPQDEKAAAEAMDGLLATPQRCAALARKAGARAARYTTDATADGVLAVYAEALAARSPLTGEAA